MSGTRLPHTIVVFESLNEVRAKRTECITIVLNLTKLVYNHVPNLSSPHKGTLCLKSCSPELRDRCKR